MTKTTPAAAAPLFRARIDRRTFKLGLFVPASGNAECSIKGVWRKLEEEGPDPTAVILHCRARIAKRSGEYRLTKDTVLTLPEGTEFAELRVLDPSDYADLEVTITPVVTLPAHMRPDEKRYGRAA